MVFHYTSCIKGEVVILYLLALHRDDESSTDTVSSQENKPKKQPLKKLSTSKDNKKKYRYADVSPESMDSKRKLQEDRTLEKNQKQTNGNSQQSSSSSSKSKTADNGEKDVMKVDGIGNDDRDTDVMLCPSLTSTPVFSSTQTKLPLNKELDFPDFSMIVNSGGVGLSNEASSKINNKNENRTDETKSISTKHKNHENVEEKRCSYSCQKSESNSLRQNLKVLIHDYNKTSKNNRPSIQDNFDHPRQKNLTSSDQNQQNTKQTNIDTHENGASSPSILPQEVKRHNDKSSKSQEKKRSSTSSSTSDLKRQRMDSSHAGADVCSVVLLSSDEEDDGRMGSSVDMFGEAEKSNKDSSLEKKTDIDSVKKGNKLRTERLQSLSGGGITNKDEDEECKPSENEYKSSFFTSKIDQVLVVYKLFPWLLSTQCKRGLKTHKTTLV